MEVTAKKEVNGEDVVVTCDVNVGSDLASAVEQFGEKVVYSSSKCPPSYSNLRRDAIPPLPARR